jgi:hypothetical protein
MYEIRENQGTLFDIAPERKKATNGPAVEGRLVLGGQTYRLSGWRKFSKRSGKGYMFLTAAVDQRAAGPVTQVSVAQYTQEKVAEKFAAELAAFLALDAAGRAKHLHELRVYEEDEMADRLEAAVSGRSERPF